MRSILGLMIGCLLAGCGSTSSIYTSEDLNRTDLVYIVAKNEKSYDQWYTYLNSAFKAGDYNPYKAVANYTSELLVPAGKYVIVATCIVNGMFAHPRIEVNLEPLKSYQVFCTGLEQTEDFFGFSRNKAIKVGIKELPDEQAANWVCTAKTRYPRKTFTANFPNLNGASLGAIEKCKIEKIDSAECQYDVKCVNNK